MDLYGLGMSGLPPEYQAQLRRAHQQQAIAQSLLEQSQEPIQNQTAGGFVVPVNPLQGLGKVAQAYVAARGMRGAHDALSQVGEKYTADQSAAIEKVRTALAPRVLPDSSAGAPATMERPIEEKIATVRDAMLNSNPVVRGFATNLANDFQAEKVLNENRAIRAQEKTDAIALEERRDKRELEQQKERDKQNFENQKALKEMITRGQANGDSVVIQTPEGAFGFDKRTRSVFPLMHNGKQLVGAPYDPNLQRDLAGAKEGGKITGKAKAESTLELPQVIDNAKKTIQNIDDIIAHPGFSSYVGATFKPFASKIDGTPEADVAARIDEVKGGAFLQAFETLKGGGQITEVEGKKATDAITRMNKAQSEKEFVTAAREFQGIIKQGVSRAQQKSGQIPSKLDVKGPAATNGGWSIIK